MKNVIFILAGLIALMLVGCGESGTSASASVDDAQVVSISGYPAVPQVPADN